MVRVTCRTKIRVRSACKSTPLRRSTGYVSDVVAFEWQLPATMSLALSE
jgi:hypothetical protein